MKNYKVLTQGVLVTLFVLATPASIAASLSDDVRSLYDKKLKDLFVHFHQNPELSFKEDKTAKRLGDELEALGYTMHRGIGGTGLVALLENGPGPTVMFRADMDGLPVEKSRVYLTPRKRHSWIGMATAYPLCMLADTMYTSQVSLARQS